MRSASVARPDITLILDLEGVIREATLSEEIDGACVKAWIGRPWTETVADVGAERVRRMVEEACANRVSMLSQVTQRLPDGRELRVEYTTVRLGDNAGLIAVGRSLRTVQDLQDRLVAAQRSMERDYWKTRQVEARIRPLLEATDEAVLMVRGHGFEIVEANAEAVHAFRAAADDGTSLIGRALLSEVSAKDCDLVRTNLEQAYEHERSPRFLARLGSRGEPWLLRASRIASGPEPALALHLSRADTGTAVADHGEQVSLEHMIQLMPDGFAILDRDGRIVKCNPAFLDLVQVGTERGVVGESLGRWLARPGADLTVLLRTVRKHGLLKLFETSIAGEFGAETGVEISATADHPTEPHYFALILRDVSRRLPNIAHARRLGSVHTHLESQVGNAPLRQLVKSTVGVIERFYIEEALERTGGNRTAAAELLGLSRQSLYTKIDRYRLDGDSQPNRQAAG